MYVYTLRIHVENDLYSQVSEILRIEPNSKYGWAYEIIENESDSPVYFIDHFLKILGGKERELEIIGATTDKIQFWMVYEYQGQCNMEFTPNDLKRIGEKGYTLCISCYEK